MMTLAEAGPAAAAGAAAPPPPPFGRALTEAARRETNRQAQEDEYMMEDIERLTCECLG